MNNQLAIIVLLVILVVLATINIWLYRHYRRNIKKVTFLFDVTAIVVVEANVTYY